MGEHDCSQHFALFQVSSLSGSENSRGHRRKCFRNIGDGSQGWALRATFQLADVALGVAKLICQFLLAPATCDTEASHFSPERLA